MSATTDNVTRGQILEELRGLNADLQRNREALERIEGMADRLLALESKVTELEEARR